MNLKWPLLWLSMLAAVSTFWQKQTTNDTYEYLKFHHRRDNIDTPEVKSVPRTNLRTAICNVLAQSTTKKDSIILQDIYDKRIPPNTHDADISLSETLQDLTELYKNPHILFKSFDNGRAFYNFKSQIMWIGDINDLQGGGTSIFVENGRRVLIEHYIAELSHVLHEQDIGTDSAYNWSKKDYDRFGINETSNPNRHKHYEVHDALECHVHQQIEPMIRKQFFSSRIANIKKNHDIASAMHFCIMYRMEKPHLEADSAQDIDWFYIGCIKFFWKYKTFLDQHDQKKRDKYKEWLWWYNRDIVEKYIREDIFPTKVQTAESFDANFKKLLESEATTR